jgi:hypothetical protein
MLGAAAAATLVIGVIWWRVTHPGVVPASGEVARQETPPVKSQPEGKPPEAKVARILPFSAASADPNENVPERTTRGFSGPATVELLAVHETLAVFDGLEYRVCSGKTPPCPKECGDSGEFASFNVKKYLKYEKFGQYGDPKQQTLSARLSDYGRKPMCDPKILSTARALKKGDYVLLAWHHNYVTQDGASFPDRPIVKLEKISKDEAESLLRTRK